jgi:hypothetical protein
MIRQRLKGQRARCRGAVLFVAMHHQHYLGLERQGWDLVAQTKPNVQPAAWASGGPLASLTHR